MALAALAVVTILLIVIAVKCPWWSSTILGRTESEWRESMRRYLKGQNQ